MSSRPLGISALNSMGFWKLFLSPSFFSGVNFGQSLPAEFDSSSKEDGLEDQTVHGLDHTIGDKMPSYGSESGTTISSLTPVEKLISGHVNFEQLEEKYLRQLLRKYYSQASENYPVMEEKRNAYFMKAKLRHGG